MIWPRRTHQRGHAGHHRLPDTGAALVEASLVAPLVLVALLGVFESALAWRDQVVLVDVAGEAARVAALHPSTIEGWAPAPSVYTGVSAVVAAVRDGLGTTRSQSLERIVVFAPAGPAGRAAIDQMPEQCRSFSAANPSDRCVVLGIDDLTGVGAAAAASCDGTCPWRQLAPDGTRPRYVGVYVRMRRQWIVPGLGHRPASEVAVLIPLEGGSRATI
jgi:hypothetical protein